MTPSSSLSGYGRQAPALVPQYESLRFEQVFGPVLHLFPAAPARILDIGAGTGNFAAALARMGHRVLAVEPTRELREAGQKLHREPGLAWLNDALPDLAALDRERERETVDFVLASAVWMHLDAAERATAMGRMAHILRPGGRLLLTLRHGPVPEGRRMFAVPAEETLNLGARHGFVPVHSSRMDDALGREGVWWSVACMDRSAL